VDEVARGGGDPRELGDLGLLRKRERRGEREKEEV
jgi:hypothetical protein